MGLAAKCYNSDLMACLWVYFSLEAVEKSPVTLRTPGHEDSRQVNLPLVSLRVAS
jgi:hypothetical protein